MLAGLFFAMRFSRMLVALVVLGVLAFILYRRMTKP